MLESLRSLSVVHRGELTTISVPSPTSISRGELATISVPSPTISALPSVVTLSKEAPPAPEGAPPTAYALPDLVLISCASGSAPGCSCCRGVCRRVVGVVLDVHGARREKTECASGRVKPCEAAHGTKALASTPNTTARAAPALTMVALHSCR